MKIEKTFFANIYVGLRSGYGEHYHMKQDATNVIAEFCNEFKTGVTVTRTEFYYVNGYESGLIVGLINYPRFPKSETQIVEDAITLARRLQIKLNQERVSIVFPNETIMLEDIENGVITTE